MLPISSGNIDQCLLKRWSSTLHILIEEPSYNRNLKEITKLAGITKSINNKLARHTNAQLWVCYGAEGAILSNMMGHSNEGTTKKTSMMSTSLRLLMEPKGRILRSLEYNN